MSASDLIQIVDSRPLGLFAPQSCKAPAARVDVRHAMQGLAIARLSCRQPAVRCGEANWLGSAVGPSRNAAAPGRGTIGNGRAAGRYFCPRASAGGDGANLREWKVKMEEKALLFRFLELRSFIFEPPRVLTLCTHMAQEEDMLEEINTIKERAAELLGPLLEPQVLVCTCPSRSSQFCCLQCALQSAGHVVHDQSKSHKVTSSCRGLQ